MNREQYVIIRNKEINNTLNGEDVARVIHERCKEGGATSEHNDLIKHCIMLLFQSDNWQPYWRKAKYYFDKKFTIMEMYSAEKIIQTPLGPKKTRDLLLVY